MKFDIRRYVYPKPLISAAIFFVLIDLLIGLAQFEGAGIPYFFWGIPPLLISGLLLGLAALMAALRKWRSALTALTGAVMAFSFISLTFEVGYLAQRMRLESVRPEYMAQIKKLSLVQGQRVWAFPWSDLRTYGPSYLLYDEADALYRGIETTPKEWVRQTEKTIAAESCDVYHLDHYRLSGHFYVVGCQDQFD
jgi:hypothetical protein